MAINVEATPPCVVTTADDMRAAAAQLVAAAERLDAFAAKGEVGLLLEARRVASIARDAAVQAACDTHAVARHELGSPDLASA